MNTYFVDKVINSKDDIVEQISIKPNEIKDYLYKYFINCSDKSIQVDLAFGKSDGYEFTKIEDTSRANCEEYTAYAKRCINSIIRDVINNKEFESIRCFVHEYDKPEIVILIERNILNKISKAEYYKIENNRYRETLKYNSRLKTIDYTPYRNIAKEVINKD